MIASLFTLVMLAVPQAAEPPVVRPAYVQPFPNGAAVDWLNGHAVVMGRVIIFRDLKKNPVNYQITQAEAEREGYARIIEALKGIPLDASTMLGAQPDVLNRFAKRIGKVPAESVVQDSGPAFRVMLKAPLWGEGGLVSLVFPEHTPQDDDAPTTTAASRREDRTGGVIRARSDTPASGLIVDARGLPADKRLEPALLPRIVDTGGRVVYGVDVVDHDFAREYGMAIYQAPQAPGAPVLPPGREGSQPIEVLAVAAGGALRTEIVIDPTSADRILAAASGSKFLQEARVLVRMPYSPPPPAVEPRVRPAPRQAPTPREPGKQ
ncbi:MAG: hypothetical protein ACREAA_21185 [Candidatus Polarisedimenticolia bacterium]